MRLMALPATLPPLRTLLFKFKFSGLIITLIESNGPDSSDSEVEYKKDETKSSMVTIPLIRLALTQRIGEYEQLVHQASESVGRGLIWERKALLPDD